MESMYVKIAIKIKKSSMLSKLSFGKLIRYKSLRIVKLGIDYNLQK